MDASQTLQLNEFLRGIVRDYPIPANELVIYRNHEKVFAYSSTGTFLHHYIYSTSKLTAMVAMMQLVEKGSLHLDDQVSSYLSEYASVMVDDHGVLRKPKSPLTIRHLATMQGGFDYNIQNPLFADSLKRGEGSTRQIIRTLAEVPLQFDPGTHFQYSLSHDVLACIVEVISGLRYADYCQRNIFLPLGMQDTTFHAKKAMAPQYRMVDGKLVPCPGNEFVFSDQYDSGGAGVVTTTEEYALLADALASEGVGKTGERILQKESIEQIRTPQLQKTQLLEYRNRLPGAGDDYSYGLGVRTHVSDDHSFSSLGEFGWDGAAGTYFLADPQKKLSLFYSEDVLSYNNSFTVIHPRLRDFIYRLLFSV